MKRIFPIVVICLTIFILSCVSVNVNLHITEDAKATSTAASTPETPKKDLVEHNLVSEIIEVIRSQSFYGANLTTGDFMALRECMHTSVKKDFVKDCFLQDSYARYIWPEKFEKLISHQDPIHWKIYAKEIFYLHIGSFAYNNFGPDLTAALDVFVKKKFSKLIIDMRGNRGGRLEYAVGLLHELSPKGRMQILIEEYGGTRSLPTLHMTFEKGAYANQSARIVVLVDKDSVSAPEVVAGVLENWGAVIIGENTYGKGMVTRMVQLSDGSMFMFSRSRVKIPKYGYYDTKGIPPTIVVDSADALEEALKYFEK